MHVINNWINSPLSLASEKCLVLLLIIILGVIQVNMVTSNRNNEDVEECTDTANWCRKLGRKIPLARCYDPRHRARCCASCERNKLPLNGCEYGDRSSVCSTIDRSRPVGDCYAHNKTCCQTCNIYNTGIPGCPFGDRVTWCSGIGDKYSVSSCYDHEIHCCETCRKFRTGIPGDAESSRCRYGDRLAWCQMIGDVLPASSCEDSSDVCCETCKLLKQAQDKFPLIESATTTSHLYRTTHNPINSSNNNEGRQKERNKEKDLNTRVSQVWNSDNSTTTTTATFTNKPSSNSLPPNSKLNLTITTTPSYSSLPWKPVSNSSVIVRANATSDDKQLQGRDKDYNNLNSMDTDVTNSDSKSVHSNLTNSSLETNSVNNSHTVVSNRNQSDIFKSSHSKNDTDSSHSNSPTSDGGDKMSGTPSKKEMPENTDYDQSIDTQNVQIHPNSNQTADQNSDNIDHNSDIRNDISDNTQIDSDPNSVSSTGKEKGSSASFNDTAYMVSSGAMKLIAADPYSWSMLVPIAVVCCSVDNVLTLTHTLLHKTMLFLLHR